MPRLRFATRAMRLASHPSIPSVLRRLALAMAAQGESAQALATIARALAQRPDDAVLVNAHAIVLQCSGQRAFWKDCHRARRHGNALYPQRIRTQVYESLQADPGLKTRELLAFCRLEFDPACLRFHENRRRVTTMSAAQVREPLRRDTAQAAKYGALFDPLRRALAAAGAFADG